MKVYAEFIEDDGILFRTKTLLQFGDSWDLIGSIIMKNPGSAKSGLSINENDKKNILEFYDEEIDFSNWTNVNADKTMEKIEPIFNGKYVNKNIELNGVIQIFNILNICNSNVESAIKDANQTQSKYLFSNKNDVIKLFKNKPVYLGFFNFYTDKTSKHKEYMEEFSKSIFNHVKDSKFSYLPFDDIIDNLMYHPFSPQIQNEKSLSILNKFASLYD